MKHIIPLLSLESSYISLSISSINTISFFEGDVSKLEQRIKDRFRDIVLLNPWLGGYLNKNKGELELIYDDDINMDSLFHTPDDVKIDLHDSYANISKTAKPFLLKNGFKLLKSSGKVSSLSLIKNKSNSFSLIFSLSHVIADGYTYYEVLNMLSFKSELKSLCVIRKQDKEAEMQNLLGKSIYHYFTGKAHFLNGLRGMIFGRKASSFAFYVDEQTIIDRKKSHCDFEVCDYISTNDILTSSFGSFIKARLLSMAVNFREKITGLENSDMGNYEGAILYDELSLKNPYAIRASILSTPFKGVHQKLPSLLEGTFCRMGLITNWFSFSKALIFEESKELLHLPLTTISGKIPYEIAIIFRVHDDKKAVMYCTSRFDKEDYLLSDMPLSSLVSEEIFI